MLLQDVLNCLLLSETVYRVHDHSNTEVARIFDSLRQDFPPSLLTLQRLQWSQPTVAHRWVLLLCSDFELASHVFSWLKLNAVHFGKKVDQQGRCLAMLQVLAGRK